MDTKIFEDSFYISSPLIVKIVAAQVDDSETQVVLKFREATVVKENECGSLKRSGTPHSVFIDY